MAEASISVAQDEFMCPVCLDLLEDPVTVSCGHSFCKVCINDFWDQEDQKGVYSCPQCRETFTPRPDLRRNNMLVEVVEKLKKRGDEAASAAHCYTGAADVECDSCTGRKLKAIKSCLVCLASFCKIHIQPHYQSPTFKKHQLVEALKLQEKICCKHNEVVKIYCRSDQTCICYLCTMDEHKGHNTVTTVAERENKQSYLKKVQCKYEERLQEKQKKVEEVKQSVITIKRSAQAAVEDSERIFTEMIGQLEKKRSEAMKLIRDQEKAELSRAERVLEQLEQEIADLKRRDAELQQLLHTEDHIHFLQSFQSLCVLSASEHSSSISVQLRPSFDEVIKSLSGLKERLEEFCRKEFNKIPSHATAHPIILAAEPKCPEKFMKSPAAPIILPEPKSREDFLTYFCHLTLDPNTAHHKLSLSEKNKVVKGTGEDQRYSHHPERFEPWNQVLCKEGVCGRCYWEVEWDRETFGIVSIAVTYKRISRKGRGNESRFGHNNQSWCLDCSSPLSVCHNRIKTEIPASPCSRIGVFVDHSAGTLSFYSVSDTMSLLHKVHTSFTQPLYPGFVVSYGSYVGLCDPE